MIDDLFTMEDDTTAILLVHAQTGAGRSEVVGRHGDALMVRVAAPPESGRANSAISKLLADRFGLAEGAVELTSGAAGRTKRFRVKGIDVVIVRAVLERLVGDTRGAKGTGTRGRR